MSRALPSQAPMTGHFYTMSASKHPSGDRSWMHDLWEVVESNGSHVLIRNAAPTSPHSFGISPMVVLVADFDWTPADEFVAHMRAEMRPNTVSSHESNPHE